METTTQQDMVACLIIRRLKHPQLYMVLKSTEFNEFFAAHIEECDVCRNKIEFVQGEGSYYDKLPKIKQEILQEEAARIIQTLDTTNIAPHLPDSPKPPKS